MVLLNTPLLIKELALAKMIILGDNMYINKRKYIMKTGLKLVLILAALSITVPAEADLKDDLKSIGLSLLLDKVLNKDDNSKFILHDINVGYTV